MRTKHFMSGPGSQGLCISLREWNSMGSTRNARGASRIEADNPRGAHPVRRSGECLSAHSWRAKNFSSTAQISGKYTVATSQTICKSTLA
jgi:hypothetical protein